MSTPRAASATRHDLMRRLTSSTASSTRVWALSVVLIALAAAIATVEVPAGAPARAPIAIPWWALALLFYVTEAKVVHLHIGRSAHSFSMSEIPVVYGIFFYAPAEFIAARLIGAGAALIISRRQRSAKLGFNLAQFLLCSVVTVGIVQGLVGGGGAEFGPRDWPAAFLATAAENAVGVLAVTAVISLAEGASQHARIPRMLLMGAIVSLTNTSLALLLITVLFVEPAAAFLFGVPIVAVFVAYRAYVSERQQHEGLEMLYESTRILQRSPQIDHALVSLLDHARKMFRAEVAEVSLLAQAEGMDILRTSVSAGEDPTMMQPIGATLDDPHLVRCLSERRAFIVARPEADEGDGERFRNAIYAPLVGESRLVGTILVANRLSDLQPFDADDLRLFETLASHTAVALENGQLEQSLSSLSRLKEELQHKAYHDALTGLANRAFFAQSVAQRLESTDPSGLVPVVLFLDLDDFKIVNDTLGHAAGDALLAEVGERIQATLRTGDLAARIGGDEFAVLLWDTPEMPVARRVAERLIGLFGLGGTENGVTTNAQVSIGVAAGHPGSGSADELLRNADVAMYSAKARGKNRVAFFEPEMATAVVARHTLTESLQRAVQSDEFLLHYQPIFEVATGRLTGLESLIRWMHPTRGMVWPGEFIPTAEASDLILDIGRWVLEHSCRQMKAWQDRWPHLRDLQISVNVAGRQLEQPDFVDGVIGIVRFAGLDPSTVVLEVTETTLLQNAEDAIAKLEALRELGIGVAIDDFGTGYSSLSYLQRFPATAIKIARDFVAVDESDTDSWELASAIVSMGRALRLMVIAEGVEEPFQLGRLRKLRCSRAQGYYLARPMPAQDLEGLLAVPPELIPWFRTSPGDLVGLSSRGHPAA